MKKNNEKKYDFGTVNFEFEFYKDGSVFIHNCGRLKEFLPGELDDFINFCIDKRIVTLKKKNKTSAENEVKKLPSILFYYTNNRGESTYRDILVIDTDSDYTYGLDRNDNFRFKKFINYQMENVIFNGMMEKPD